MKKCLACGTGFISKLDRGLFCSDLCRASFNQMIKRKSSGIILKIYVLKDPDDFSIFYVGRTVMTLDFRLKGHIKEANDGAESKKRYFIQRILKNGAIPIIELVEEYICYSVEDEINVNKREIELLSKYTLDGHDMCNLLGTKKSNIEHAIRPLLGKYFSKSKFITPKVEVKQAVVAISKSFKDGVEKSVFKEKIGEVEPDKPTSAVPKYNFTCEKFLVIEKYTQYPMAQKPANPVEAKIWLGKKKTADQKIKDAWNLRKG